MSSLSSSTQRSGFTLIELLVVIAIIAILASLAFPSVQGALQQGKKTQARNDVNQLAIAVKNYQLEYGKLPGTNQSTGEILNVLIASNATLNPRNIIFFEPKNAKNGKNGWDGSTYLDPWGDEYTFILDLGYSNKITTDAVTGTNQTFFTTVIVTSPGGSTNSKDIISNVK
jgi:type II secretion system protein G